MTFTYSIFKVVLTLCVATFQDESCVDIDCRNSDGLTPLLLVTRDIQFFDKFSEMLTGGYDPTQVISELLDHDA